MIVRRSSSSSSSSEDGEGDAGLNTSSVDSRRSSSDVAAARRARAREAQRQESPISTSVSPPRPRLFAEDHCGDFTQRQLCYTDLSSRQKSAFYEDDQHAPVQPPAVTIAKVTADIGSRITAPAAASAPPSMLRCNLHGEGEPKTTPQHTHQQQEHQKSPPRRADRMGFAQVTSRTDVAACNTNTHTGTASGPAETPIATVPVPAASSAIGEDCESSSEVLSFPEKDVNAVSFLTNLSPTPADSRVPMSFASSGSMTASGRLSFSGQQASAGSNDESSRASTGNSNLATATATATATTASASTTTVAIPTTVLGRLQPLPPLPPFQNYPFPLPRESSYDVGFDDEEYEKEGYEDDFEDGEDSSRSSASVAGEKREEEKKKDDAGGAESQLRPARREEELRKGESRIHSTAVEEPHDPTTVLPRATDTMTAEERSQNKGFAEKRQHECENSVAAVENKEKKEEAENSMLDDRVSTDLSEAPINDVGELEDGDETSASIDDSLSPYRSAASPTRTIPNLSIPTLPTIATPRGTSATNNNNSSSSGGGIGNRCTGSGAGAGGNTGASLSHNNNNNSGGGYGGGDASSQSTPRGTVPRMPSPLLSSRSPRQYVGSPVRPAKGGGTAAGGRTAAARAPQRRTSADTAKANASVQRPSSGEAKPLRHRRRPRAHTDSPMRRSAVVLPGRPGERRSQRHERPQPQEEQQLTNTSNNSSDSTDNFHSYLRLREVSQEVTDANQWDRRRRRRRSGSGSAGSVSIDDRRGSSPSSSPLDHNPGAGAPRHLRWRYLQRDSGECSSRRSFPRSSAAAATSTLRSSFTNEVVLSDLSALGRSRSGQSQESIGTPLSVSLTDNAAVAVSRPHRFAQFQRYSPSLQATASSGEGRWASSSPLTSGTPNRADCCVNTGAATAAAAVSAATVRRTNTTSPNSSFSVGQEDLPTLPSTTAANTVNNAATAGAAMASSGLAVTAANTISSTTLHSSSLNGSFATSFAESPLLPPAIVTAARATMAVNTRSGNTTAAREWEGG